jgi:hypothetical protein
VAWLVLGRQAQVLEAPLLEQMAGQVALVQALHDYDFSSALRVV